MDETVRFRPWPVVPACIGWIAGTAAHLETVSLHPQGVYVAGTVMTLMLWGIWHGLGRRAVDTAGSVSPRRLSLCGSRRVFATGLLAAAMAFCLAGWRAAHQDEHRLSPDLEGRDLVVQGVVARLPQVNRDGVRFLLTVEHAWLGTTNAPLASLTRETEQVGVPERILLSGSSGSEGHAGLSIRAGDRWLLPVRLKAPHGQLNPHGFDFEAWLWSQGVMAVGQVRGTMPATKGPTSTLPRLLAHTGLSPWERLRQACRDRLWAQGLSPGATGVLSALILGDQATIDPLDWDVFRRTGVAHLMSISGLHITLLAALVRWALQAGWARASWRRRPLTLWYPAPQVEQWGGWGFALAYALFSGWGLPAQRTVIMLGTVVLLRSIGTPWPWGAVWLLACALVLAWESLAWLQAGFWLSFVAVGLLMALDTSPVRAPTDADGRIGGWQAVRRAGAGLWREQVLMTLGLAPLTLLLFHETTPLGLVANWVAIPWVTLCVTPLALLGVVWPMAWQGGAAALAGLQGVLSWLLACGVPSWSVAAFPVWVGVLGVLGAALLCWRGPWCWRWWGFPLMLPALYWQTEPPRQGDVTVVVADVGQGQAVLVRTARHVLLYDAGPRYAPDVDAGQRVVLPLLHSLGLGLDRLVLSHGDTDHTGGAQAVLHMHPQAQVMGSLRAHSPLVGRPGYQDCQAGAHWVWEGVRFDVLHPDRTQPLRSASNARSCVLRIKTANATLLLTGDLESPEEATLVARWGAGLSADVMLVPHHGSKTSSSAVFLDTVQPRWAWVQAGYRNRFGHPASEVLARYQARLITVLETARCGAILWRSQAPQSMQCERASRQRYWHHRPA